MKKFIPFLLLLLVTGIVTGATHNSLKAKHKKKRSKAKSQGVYTGSLMKIQDPNAVDPSHAGFVINGHFQFTVVETVTPTIRFSGAVQPKVHICVEGPTGYKNQQGRCIEELCNGYGNMVWDANASTKCYIAAYKPDGTQIHIKKELLKGKPAAWKGNVITWEDDEYKVSIKISTCKVEPNQVCICPR